VSSGRCAEHSASITCNIAEGYGRATRGEYLNHISMARGSLNEVETVCEDCGTLEFLNDSALKPVSELVDRMRRTLGRLRLRLSEGRRRR
jgi:four helix bundle protein